jgi:hypothetical protein
MANLGHRSILSGLAGWHRRLACPCGSPLAGGRLQESRVCPQPSRWRDLTTSGSDSVRTCSAVRSSSGRARQGEAPPEPRPRDLRGSAGASPSRNGLGDGSLASFETLQFGDTRESGTRLRNEPTSQILRSKSLCEFELMSIANLGHQRVLWFTDKVPSARLADEPLPPRTAMRPFGQAAGSFRVPALTTRRAAPDRVSQAENEAFQRKGNSA